MMKLLKYMILTLLTCWTSILLANSPTAPSHKADVLFTQLAQSATITPMHKANWYKITLNKVAEHTAWFADRPARRHGKLTTKRFVQLWHQGKNDFAQNPPNANLVFLSTTNHGLTETHEHIAKLTAPHYQPTAQKLSYQVELLPPAHKIAVTKTNEVALFIDSFDPGCINIFKCL